MLWFFEREEQSVRLETRYDNDTAEYVAVTTYPDGREETERFSDADRFRQWLEAWERVLEAEHWTRGGSPIVLPDGWPHRRPLK
jgi:hypothetical protein